MPKGWVERAFVGMQPFAGKGGEIAAGSSLPGGGDNSGLVQPRLRMWALQDGDVWRRANPAATAIMGVRALRLIW